MSETITATTASSAKWQATGLAVPQASDVTEKNIEIQADVVIVAMQRYFGIYLLLVI